MRTQLGLYRRSRPPFALIPDLQSRFGRYLTFACEFEPTNFQREMIMGRMFSLSSGAMTTYNVRAPGRGVTLDGGVGTLSAGPSIALPPPFTVEACVTRVGTLTDFAQAVTAGSSNDWFIDTLAAGTVRMRTRRFDASQTTVFDTSFPLGATVHMAVQINAPNLGSDSWSYRSWANGAQDNSGTCFYTSNTSGNITIGAAGVTGVLLHFLRVYRAPLHGADLFDHWYQSFDQPGPRRKAKAPAAGTTLSVGRGQIGWTGKAVTVNARTKLSPGRGRLDWTGRNVTVNARDTVSPERGRFDYTGRGVTVNAERVVTPAPAAVNWTGKGVTVSVGGAVTLTPGRGRLNWTGRGVTINAETVLTPARGRLNWTGQAVNINARRVLTIGKTTLEFTGRGVTVNARKVVIIPKGVLNWTGRGVTLVTSATVLQIGKAALNWTGRNLQVIAVREGITWSPAHSPTMDATRPVPKLLPQDRPDSKQR